MILVDSSVWVQIFRFPQSEPLTAMQGVIEIEIATCGVVVQEVLQGFKRQADFEWFKSKFLMIPWLEAPHEVYLKAAQMAKDLRETGITITAVDALIASIAMRANVQLWTLDKDFDSMVSKGLRLYRKK